MVVNHYHEENDMASFHPVLDRVPARGILKSEHDKYVKLTGRSYTDPFITHHGAGHMRSTQHVGEVQKKSTKSE